MVKIYKDTKLFRIFLWQNVLISPIPILYIIQKKAEIFSFIDFSDTRYIRRYCFKYFQVYIYIGIFIPKSKKNYSQRFQCSQTVYIKIITP